MSKDAHKQKQTWINHQSPGLPAAPTPTLHNLRADLRHLHLLELQLLLVLLDGLSHPLHQVLDLAILFLHDALQPGDAVLQRLLVPAQPLHHQLPLLARLDGDDARVLGFVELGVQLLKLRALEDVVLADELVALGELLVGVQDLAQALLEGGVFLVQRLLHLGEVVELLGRVGQAAPLHVQVPLGAEEGNGGRVPVELRLPVRCMCERG
jgi:hypothetical protein